LTDQLFDKGVDTPPKSPHHEGEAGRFIPVDQALRNGLVACGAIFVVGLVVIIGLASAGGTSGSSSSASPVATPDCRVTAYGCVPATAPTFTAATSPMSHSWSHIYDLLSTDPPDACQEVKAAFRSAVVQQAPATEVFDAIRTCGDHGYTVLPGN